MAASSVAWAWKWLADLADVEPGQRGEPRGRPRRVLRVGVDPGPDRGPAERDLEQLVARRPRPPDRLLDLAGVAPELLAEPDRASRPGGASGRSSRPARARRPSRRAPRGASRAPAAAPPRSRSPPTAGAPSGSCRSSDWHLLTSSLGWTCRSPPSRRVASVRDDLVHVRVRRGARAGLVDVDRELGVVAAVGDLGGGGGDRLGDVVGSRPSSRVRLGRRLLDQGEGPDEPSRQAAGRRSGSSGPPAASRRRTGRRPGPPSRPSSRARCGSRRCRRSWSSSGRL